MLNKIWDCGKFYQFIFRIATRILSSKNFVDLQDFRRIRKPRGSSNISIMLKMLHNVKNHLKQTEFSGNHKKSTWDYTQWVIEWTLQWLHLFSMTLRYLQKQNKFNNGFLRFLGNLRIDWNSPFLKNFHLILAGFLRNHFFFF